MVNSKGGFLVEDGKEVDEERIRKEKERERQRAKQDLEPRSFMRISLLSLFDLLFDCSHITRPNSGIKM
jgi:hypothetical protein